MSWGNNKRGVIYNAAVSLRDDDGIPDTDFESFIIRKGKYNGDVIHNFMSETRLIGQTFHQLLQEPDVAADGYCMELYLNRTNVRCLIKLNDQ